MEDQASDSPIGLETIPNLVPEAIPSDKMTATTSVYTPDTCKICGTETIYEDSEEFAKHKRTRNHKLKLQQMEHDARKKRTEKIYKTEGYYTHTGKTAVEYICVYIETLTTFWALRYCFSTYNKNFKISLDNLKWWPFDDVVIELWDDQEITEIQAIQFKKIQRRDTILLSSLTAMKGEFSLKKCWDDLKKLQSNQDYDKAYFKMYTVSNLTINRETFDGFKYGDDTEWKGKSLIVPEYNKMNILNTTDDLTDICTFKILNENDETSDNILDKFCMLTNQKKIKDLKNLIKSTLRNQFPNCKDITIDLVHYVSDHFKLGMTNMGKTKLTKKDFLLKVMELLLEPYSAFPHNFIQGMDLELWNELLLNFDITVMKNHPDMLGKIYSAINYKLNKTFDSCDYQDIDLYLRMWRDQLTPLVLSADDETDLSLIGQLAEFLKDENIPLKFIVLTKNPKIDYGIFPTSLSIFSNLQDLKETNLDLLEKVLSQIKIQVLDFEVSLGCIVECNDSFLEKVTLDALLNMFLHKYSFEDIHLPLTNEVGDNTIVLTNEDIEKVKSYFQRQNTEPKARGLSYEVSVKGKPRLLQVPPEL